MQNEHQRLARRACAGVKQVDVSAPEHEPHNAETLRDALANAGITGVSVDPSSGIATGLTPDGRNAVIELATALRAARGRSGYTLRNATLAEFIATTIKRLWSTRNASTLKDEDFGELEEAIEDWFASHDVVRQHIVPCTVFPAPVGPFTIGPVTFYHAHELPTDMFGMEQDEFWPPAAPRWKQRLDTIWAAFRGREVRKPKPGGWQLSNLLEFAAARNAPYLAIVEVSGRAQKESVLVAEMTTDIALSAIQLVSPGDDMRKLSRATARTAPIYPVRAHRVGDSPFGMEFSNRQPGLARAPELIGSHIEAAQPLLAVMGRRLTAYVHAEGAFPTLNEAWCNAAYWYHEALAEPLDTVAVAKLETAIEVLMRAESMKGSKRRLLEAFKTFLGLSDSDLVAENGPTVDELVAAITTARSRILHGTWPTLHTDLPSAKGKPTIAFATVEEVARLLLLFFAKHLDAYADDGQSEDDTAAFLSWIRDTPNRSTVGDGQTETSQGS